MSQLTPKKKHLIAASFSASDSMLVKTYLRVGFDGTTDYSWLIQKPRKRITREAA